MPELKFPDFMPFESDSKRTHKISTQRITGQSLRAFLCKDFDKQQVWMDEAKQLLCSPSSASQVSLLQHIIGLHVCYDLNSSSSEGSVRFQGCAVVMTTNSIPDIPFIAIVCLGCQEPCCLLYSYNSMTMLTCNPNYER